jgi:anti-sigma-K factor RskA
MTREWTNGAGKPTPEQLAAYADGELDAASRRHCAAWLENHPEAAAEVETWRRLNRLWQASAPEEPGPAVWAATCDRIEKSLPSGPPVIVRPRRKLFLWASLLTAAAAAALTISLSARLFHAVPGVLTDPEEEPYPVAEAHEVAIISMDVKDADALVVGETPIHGPLAFADFDDIILVDAKRLQHDAPQPWLVDEQLALPMIVPQPPPWEGR